MLMADFEWYRSFVAVYQTGTLAAAAQRRQVDKSSIRQHIAALEAQLRSTLFERKSRRMIPTPEAKTLYEKVIEAVQQLEGLSSSTVFVEEECNKIQLRVGVPRAFFYAKGIRFLAKQIGTNCELDLVIGQPRALLKKLNDGQLDAVVVDTQYPESQFQYLPLDVEHFILVGSGKLPAPDKLSRSETIHWLEAQAWVSNSPDMSMIGRYWEEVFEQRPKVEPRLVVSDLLMVLQAVRFGIGVSVLPEYLCRESIARGDVRMLYKPEKHPANQLYLACSESRAQAKEIKWFLNYMREGVE